MRGDNYLYRAASTITSRLFLSLHSRFLRRCAKFGKPAAHMYQVKDPNRDPVTFLEGVMRHGQEALVVISVILFPFNIAAQTAVTCSFTVSSAVGDSMTVQIGSAPGATAGIDAALGEMEIPPLPPPGVFDVRLTDPDTVTAALGEGVWLDLRAGGLSAPDSTGHLLLCQCGRSSDLTIAWVLPQGHVAIITSPPGVSPHHIIASGTGSAPLTAIVGLNAFAITLYRNMRILAARVFLEGAFNPTTLTMRTTLRDTGVLADHFPGIAIPSLAVDSITVILHDSASLSTSHTCTTLPAWLLADGTVSPFQPPFDLPLLLRGTPFVALYLDIRHRNHLPAHTAQPLPDGLTALNCDMTTRADIFAGSNAARLAPGVYGLIAGDSDGDGQTGTADLSLVRSSIGRPRGYTTHDTDLNAGVGATDLALVRWVMATSLGVP